MKKHFTLFALAVVLLGAAAGGWLGQGTGASAASLNEKDALFQKFSQVLNVIEKSAVPLGPPEDIIYSAVRQMLQQLDPHSSFFTPKDYAALQEDNSGRYFGLGIRIRALTRGSGRIVVLEPPFPGTPAAKVGLQAGDVIYKVNDESIDEWDVDDVIDHLKGPKGTKVHITVLRPGDPAPLEMDVVRDEIPKLTINYAYRIRPSVGYIKLEHFSETSTQELQDAMKRLDSDTLEGLVLDLRDDPGGYLNQAIKICQEFLPKNAPIVSTRDRDGSDEQKYASRTGGNLTLPMVVLINGNSASASEIVAGAFQDNDRAVIFGERSFGKGLVQSVYKLSDGSGLALTTGKYYMPSGRCLQRPYNGSVYDYYNPRLRKSQAPSEVDSGTTLSGRKVFGGGGIQPDIEFKSRKLNRFELTMYSKDVFFKFATQAMQGKVPSVNVGELHKAGAHFEVSDAVLNDFREFMSNLKMADNSQEFDRNLDFIRRGIKAEVATRVSGVLEGFKIRSEGDDQLLKSLDAIPGARSMLLKTKEIIASSRVGKNYADIAYQD